jgi:hypothetical protein
MFREVFVRVMLVVLYTSLNGCGGATTTGEHVDTGAGDGLFACNDGTGATDCCPDGAMSGAPCSSDSTCWTRCSNGFRGEMSCSGGTWIAGHGLFQCGSPGADAGLSGPAACAAAGGKCVVGGFTGCLKDGPQDCNPDRNPGGAFCCLEDDPTCAEANGHVISAADYDQTCTIDSDCIGVGEGDACNPCAIACPTAAIKITAKARYLADVAKTPAGAQQGTVRCGCPASFGPCCLGSMCHADLMCSTPGP